jgi:hypothetical protein
MQPARYISGNRDGVKRTKGSQKVLAPTAMDQVFVYFADHGGRVCQSLPGYSDCSHVHTGCHQLNRV